MPKLLHDPPVFFVDRSLGGKIVPEALGQDGWVIKRHDDHFQQDTPDTEWITDVGKRKWAILTADSRIRYNPLERAALLASKTHVFILAGRKNLTGRDMAARFITAKTAILKAIEETRPPAVFKVLENGKLDLMLSGSRKKH